MGVKYVVDEKFFKKWTEKMAYVLGYFYADGSMEDAYYLRGKYIRFSSAEKNNILKIKKWIGSQHKLVERKSADGRRLYLLRIGSHVLYEDLTKLGLYPRKSLTINFPKVPKKYISHFIRGYFDGDGSVRIWMSKGKSGKLVLRKLCTVFTSGSEVFLKDLAISIQKHIHTKHLKIYNGNKSFMLSYSTGDSVKIFKLMYGKFDKETCLERKFKRFAEYFRLRPQRVDKKIESILQYMGL